MQDIVLIKEGMRDSTIEDGDMEHKHANNDKTVDISFPEFREMKKCLDPPTNATSKFVCSPNLE